MDKERQIYKLIKEGVASIVTALSKPKVELLGAELITIKGQKGDVGAEPSDKRLVEIIKPLIPDPIKGKDGEDGKDYILTEEDKGEIASKIEVPIVEKIIEKTETIVEKPTITQIVKEVAVKDTPAEIEKKILTLKKSWIPIDMIDGDFNTKVRPPVMVPGGRPLDVLVNGESFGIAREINFVGNAISAEIINGIVTVTVSDSGGTGFTKETPTGNVDGNNTVYTVTHEPNYIVSDGITLFDGVGYTYSALSITLINAPSLFIRSYY